MFKRLRPSFALVATALALTAFTACGGSSSHTIPSNSVALVGATPISKTTLDHWMHSMVGGDFWERFIKRAPAGLVSEPADYAACEAAARTLIAEGTHKLHFTPAQVAQKCRQLYFAIREQALQFLINVSWRVNEGRENGITVSDAETSNYAKQYIAKFYPNPGEYEKYLANREWAPSDDLYQVKRNLLTTKLREKIEGTGAGEKRKETPQVRTRYIDYVEGHIGKRTAETRCRAAYVVSMCRGFREAGSPPAPVAILEEFLGE